jgi:hypothetical protein
VLKYVLQVTGGGATWESCSIAVPSFSVRRSLSCKEHIVVPIVTSFIVDFGIRGKNNRVNNIEWIIKRKSGGLGVWEDKKTWKRGRKYKRRRRRERRVEISIPRIWNYVRIESFNFQISFNMVWIMVFRVSSFFTLGPGSWHILLHIFLLFRTPKGCSFYNKLSNLRYFGIPFCVSSISNMSPLPFYLVYPPSTRSKISFILPGWMGDDNQNQIFAAGLKNCVIL